MELENRMTYTKEELEAAVSVALGWTPCGCGGYRPKVDGWCYGPCGTLWTESLDRCFGLGGPAILQWLAKHKNLRLTINNTFWPRWQEKQWKAEIREWEGVGTLIAEATDDVPATALCLAFLLAHSIIGD